MNTIKKYFDSIGGYDMGAHVTIKDCDKGLLYDGTCEHMPIILMKRELLSAVKLTNGGTVWYNFTLIERPEEPEEPKEKTCIIELTQHEASMLSWAVTKGLTTAIDRKLAGGDDIINTELYGEMADFYSDFSHILHEHIMEMLKEV